MEGFGQDQSTIKAVNGKEKENHRDQATSNKDAGDDLDLDDEAHQSIYLLNGKHDPCCSPCTFDANHAHGSNVTSKVRGAAKQIESEPVTTNTAFTEAQRLFFADELFSAGLQDYNPNGIFGSLESTFLPVAAPLESRSQELEGRSMPADHVDSPLNPAIMIRASRLEWLGNRKDSDASELVESMVNRRKLLLKEHCDALPRVSPSSTVQNFNNNGIDLNSISRGSEIDVDEFRQCQGNDENLHALEEEVLMKTMGWFPVEEYPKEDSDATLSLHWILDEQPSVSDLPHLESLMEISPSKFWSPNSESSKRPPIQFGFLNLSDSPQSSHSIQYFLNDSPTSSPEVARTILGGASGVKISSKEANRQCSRACRNIHGTTQIIRTPMSAIGESREKIMTSLSSGADRKFGAQVQGVPEKSPALSEDNPMKYASREEHKAAPVHKDHTNHQEIRSVARLTSSDKDARRLQLLQSGKNLVMNFLEVGRTQENVEARQVTNDIPLKDTIQPLWTQNENTLDQTRRQCMTEIPTKERESTSPPLELQATLRADGNWVTKRESHSDQNCTRIRDVPLLPPSDISYLPNLVTSLRNSLHEKLESQLLYQKPLLESHKNEGFVTLQCPKPTPNNFAWSSPAVPRVSRKRSSRITTPKITRVDVLNLFGNGKIPQPLRTTPDKDLHTCKRRKRTRKNTFVELPTSQRNVKLQSTPASACEIDTRDMGMKEGTRSQKSPILTRIIKPLRLITTSPAKGYTCVRRKWTLRSTVKKGLPTDPRNVNANQVTKHAPIKHLGDVSEAVVSAEMNPRSSGSTTHRHKVKEESLRTSPVGSEMSDVGTLRSSKYRGVTRHRHTGRYEAHLWDNTKVKLGLAKRGRQVYLGAYPNEDQAAQAHDLAALKYWGHNVYTNFPPTLYEEELKAMKNLTKEEYIVILRRRSPGFTRGISKYRGVTRHHQEGRWEARIGRHSGAKYHYLGTYDTQEEAAAAYDRAAVRHRGVNAITNFDLSNYIKTKPKANRSVSPTSSPSGQS